VNTGLDSLELRRLRHDLIFTYKSISNKLYTDKDQGRSDGGYIGIYTPQISLP